MYHGRFKNSHYEAGFRYGCLLNKNNKILDSCPTFSIDADRLAFGKKCTEVIENYYPEIIEEIRGLADGNKASFEFLSTLIFSMYCYDVNNRCSCFAFKNNQDIIFGRNSDFLVSIEKLYMNVIYKLNNVYSFNGNTTAFIEIEDGMNEKGLSVGLTFIPIEKVKPGFNVGVLTRFLLEKCTSVNESIEALKKLPIASGGTLTIADKKGDMAVVELHPDEINIIYPNNNYVCATNIFTSNKMKKYNLSYFDNWQALERYNTLESSLKKQKYSIKFAQELLSGKYGFICQYDRTKNADTVWSSIYDMKKMKIYRVEGNPGRKSFKEDIRMKWRYKDE